MYWSYYYVGLDILGVCVKLFLELIVGCVSSLEEHVYSFVGFNNLSCDMQIVFHATNVTTKHTKEFDSILGLVELVVLLGDFQICLQRRIILVSEYQVRFIVSLFKVYPTLEESIRIIIPFE